jgi:hypothetical protein
MVPVNQKKTIIISEKYQGGFYSSIQNRGKKYLTIEYKIAGSVHGQK